MDLENCINELEVLFDQAMKRVKNLNSDNTIYGLGLSGGMDSRLTAYYALKNKLKLKTFIFGEENSDAYYIAKKIAKLLKLNHYELGFSKKFFKYFEKSIDYNPMMNILYTWYYAIYKKLPNFEILLTGYNGDNQFGSHLKKSDLKIKSDKDFVSVIFKKYCELGNLKKPLNFFNNQSKILILIRKLIKFSRNSQNLKFWQKKEEFNYKYRQRIYIKNNPSLNFFGLYKSFSIFIDYDLLEFLMKIPFAMRLNRKLFFKFLRKKLPLLLKIRPDRDIPINFENFLLKFIFRIIRFFDLKFHTNLIFKKSHKSIEKWMSNNRLFINYLDKIFSKENYLFYELINQNKIMNLISKGKWDFYETSLLFRFLTIKLFLDKMKDYFIKK